MDTRSKSSRTSPRSTASDTPTLVVTTSFVTRPLSGIIPVDSVTSPRETNFDKTFAAAVTGRRDPHMDASARGGDFRWPSAGTSGGHQRGLGGLKGSLQ